MTDSPLLRVTLDRPIPTPSEVAALVRLPESTVLAMARDGRLFRLPRVRRVLIASWSVEV